MYANRTVEQTNQDLSNFIRTCTDQDILVWSDFQEDDYTYSVHFGEDNDKLTVCCDSAIRRRRLWFNDKLTSVIRNKINEIHKAIIEQKIRLSEQQKVSEEAIASLTHHINVITYSRLTGSTS